MFQSWKLGQFKGIDVYVHWSFTILAAVIGISTLMSYGLTAALGTVGMLLAVFGCVVLHEFGHALAARSYGIGTHDITLYPIGGVARLERMPKNPHHELVVALAGPAVNVAIAAALFAGLKIAGQLGGLSAIGVFTAPFLVQLLWTNIALVVFNLLPAFPMDGGRVLRALLAMRLPYVSATQIAARVGQFMAVLLGIVGLTHSPMLIFVAAFVFLAARSEANAVRNEHFAARRWETSSPVEEGPVSRPSTPLYWEHGPDGVVTIHLPPRSRVIRGRVCE